jgi:hypothetical protein
MTNDRRPRNPLILDDDYEKLFDDDFLESIEDLEESDPVYDYLSNGSRRKKPMNYSDL